MTTVTAHLMGGMANQMFQYAAGLALARRCGAELVLDTSWYLQGIPDRPYRLGQFGLPERTVESEVSAVATRRWLSRRPVLKAAVRTVARGDLRVGWYREPSHHFDPGFFRQKPPCEIRGYFQSPLYFEGVEAELRARFSRVPDLSPDASRWAAIIRARPCAVAVHVRGGDYLQQGASAQLEALTPAYYLRAIEVLGALLARPMDVFVFTDDPAHAAAVLPAGLRGEHVSTPADRPWEDMHLMSLCRHNIIANSSFSWWGAWLGEREDQRVIAPRRWFTPQTLRKKNTCDLYPQGWILV